MTHLTIQISLFSVGLKIIINNSEVALYIKSTYTQVYTVTQSLSGASELTVNKNEIGMQSSNSCRDSLPSFALISLAHPLPQKT